MTKDREASWRAIPAISNKLCRLAQAARMIRKIWQPRPSNMARAKVEDPTNRIPSQIKISKISKPISLPAPSCKEVVIHLQSRTAFDESVPGDVVSRNRVNSDEDACSMFYDRRQRRAQSRTWLSSGALSRCQLGCLNTLILRSCLPCEVLSLGALD